MKVTTSSWASCSLFAAASTVGAEVLDLEQVVVRGHLALSVLLSPGRDENVLVEAARDFLAGSSGAAQILQGAEDAMRKYADAQAAVAKALAADAKHAAAHLLAGELLEATGQIDKAVAAYRWFETLEPKTAEPMTLTGQALMRIAKYDGVFVEKGGDFQEIVVNILDRLTAEPVLQ